MVEPVFEILLHAETSTRFGRRGRWYLADAHTDRRVADWLYVELCERYPQRGISIAPVRSELDGASGLYHDRVLVHRGRVPLIRRAEVERLTEAAKREIARAHPPAGKGIDLGRSRPPPAAGRGSVWPWLAAAAAPAAALGRF